MPATISVIIPTLNRAHLLPEAVHSILAQTRMVNELIIWDDGSTDNTGAIAEQLGTIMAGAKHAELVPAFKYERSENGGKSRAMNAALKHATGDYIWFCDDDDLALPHAAETLAKVLDEDPALFAAGGSYRRFDVDPKTKERTEHGPGYWPDLSSGTVLRHLLEDAFLFQNAMLVRREVFDRVGPFREDLKRSMDYDMIVRIACAGPVKVLDDPVFLQRQHDGQRGPLDDQRAANKSDDTWKETDKVFFTDLRERMPLALYEGMFRAEDHRIVRRAALLQRACVYARRTDWEMALRDLADAAKLSPAFSLSQTERGICRRAFGGKHGVKEALTSETRRALREIAGMSASGGSVTRALARGMSWRGKEAMRAGRLSEAAAVAKFVSALSLTTSPYGRGDLPGPVFENDALPEQSYRVV